MEKIFKLFILILITIGMTRCKPQQETIRYTSLSDTLIRHTTESVILPGKITTIIKEPCKDSLININQTVKSGNATAQITSQNGDLIIDLKTDTIKSVSVSETSKQNTDKITIKTVTETVTPKWVWYILTYSIVITLWLLRKPIMKLINPLW